jgi:HSP20 family molecular chaperone IbpA
MSDNFLMPRAPMFDALDDLFDFDKHFYFFNRDEKDMHPYDVIRKKDALILTHNVLGLEKEDIKLTIKTENLKNYIVISGSSKDEVTGKCYSINSRFSYDPNEIDITKATSEMKNGLLYITIPYKAKEEVSDNEIQIEIK